METRGLKVGELAVRTGLTVRTLHHYDEIGLLRPARRTPSGHRVYGLEEVQRLQQIASLRQLGLPLDEIRECLDRERYSLEQVLEMQIQRLGEEIGRQSRLVDLLSGIRGRLAAGDLLSLEDVTSAIEATVQLEKYYTPEQLGRLARRAETLGSDGLRGAQEEWAALFAAMDGARGSGLAPDAPEVQVLARKAEALIGAFTGGDPDIHASLQRMYEEGAGTRAIQGQGMAVDPDVMAYYGRAMAALRRPGR